MLAHPKILIIDDQPTLLKSFSNIFQQQSFETVSALSEQEAFQKIEAEIIAVVLVSMNMKGVDSCSLIQALLRKSPESVCIALASGSDVQQAIKALEVGAVDYFQRPIRDWARFFHLIRQSMQVWERTCELNALKSHMENLQRHRALSGFYQIKGNSPSVHAVMDTVHLVAPLRVSTLIYGESGVGKELVARAIHKASPYKDGPFVAINCAAIQADLFESELFGHERGAFTGAHIKKEGLCSAAKEGTLFLDEIGDLPLSLQPKLLRLLEQKCFRTVGGNKTIDFHARVICATHVDLEKAVEEGKFRKDLYFRLSAQEVYVPPLRERVGDIQLLAYHFIEKYNKLCNRNVQSLSSDALVLLESHDWSKNNVRELEREIQRGVVRAGSSTILEVDMLFWSRGKQILPEKDATFRKDWLRLEYGEAQRLFKRLFLKEYLEHKLLESSGNKSKAAKLAGLAPSNFHRLLRQVEEEVSQNK